MSRVNPTRTIATTMTAKSPVLTWREPRTFHENGWRGFPMIRLQDGNEFTPVLVRTLTPEKLPYRHVGIKRRPDDDKVTSRGLSYKPTCT
jgi:hypothetical protein